MAQIYRESQQDHGDGSSSTVSQETDHVRWTIVELFYRSQNIIAEQVAVMQYHVDGSGVTGWTDDIFATGPIEQQIR